MMYAIVGIPGSTHHRYRRYPRSQTAQARAWLDATWEAIMRRNPAIGTLPTRLISDREAASIRWQDGRRIYDKTEPWREDWS
jgi:hypothetical protein